MVSIISTPKKSLFHYAHFIIDCLYPEIINDVYKYEKVFRIKNIEQTIGNFKNVYEEIMQIESIELPNNIFLELKNKIIKIPIRESYVELQYMNKFRNYIFSRYNIDPLVYNIDYPEVLLIKRGKRIELINDSDLKKINNNISNGSERREIKDINIIEEYLQTKYSNKFKSVFLECMPFNEQVKLFNNAKLIILAHGAAMSNMFFCKKNTTILEVTCNTIWPFFDIISKNLELNHIKINKNESDHIIQILSELNKLF